MRQRTPGPRIKRPIAAPPAARPRARRSFEWSSHTLDADAKQSDVVGGFRFGDPPDDDGDYPLRHSV